MLERRLDNVVFRLGFATSRNQGRQLVTHRHFRVNGKFVNIPSYLVRVGDGISVKEKSRSLKVIKDAVEIGAAREVREWMVLDVDGMEGKIVRLPNRQDITIPVQEELIVALYSRS